MMSFILGYYLNPKSHRGSAADLAPLASMRIQQGSEYLDSHQVNQTTDTTMAFFPYLKQIKK